MRGGGEGGREGGNSQILRNSIATSFLILHPMAGASKTEMPTSLVSPMWVKIGEANTDG